MQEFGVTLPGVRRLNDFYPTEAAATEVLAREYAPYMGKVWEPACGDGAIMRVLSRHGVPVVGSDLVHRGAGIGGIDYLETSLEGGWSIVTNPPYDKLAGAFIRKAIQDDAPFIAMLLKVSYWTASTRLPLWRMKPPKACRPLTWRPDFTGQGSPFLNLMWVIWGDDVPISCEPFEKP